MKMSHNVFSPMLGIEMSHKSNYKTENTKVSKHWQNMIGRFKGTSPHLAPGKRLAWSGQMNWAHVDGGPQAGQPSDPLPGHQHSVPGNK